MKNLIGILTLIWISGVLMSGCSSSKTKMFGDDLPTMKEIHDKKFNHVSKPYLPASERIIEESLSEADGEFHWLPNPTLTMYVFKHLTPAGHPIPGYRTFFRLYTRSHIAEPGEQAEVK